MNLNDKTEETSSYLNNQLSQPGARIYDPIESKGCISSSEHENSQNKKFGEEEAKPIN